MSTNLTPEYVQFVERGNSLEYVLQEVIDRMQYVPGFLEHLESVLNSYESPFEVVNISRGDCHSSSPKERVRRLKEQYCKPKSNPDDSRHAEGNSGNQPV